MELSPLTQKIYLELIAPSEGDNMADADRLRQALEEQLGQVSLPAAVVMRDYEVIHASGYRVTAVLYDDGQRWTLLAIEPGDTRLSHYGLAADLGSTTVSVALLDLNTGALLAETTDVNGQVEYGTDILTRIFYTKDNPQRRKELQQVTVDTLRDLIGEVCCDAGILPEQCSALTVAGNTTMMQFLYGIDAFPVFISPFAPVTCHMEPVPARELGLDLPLVVYSLPCSANYLGGDSTAGILTTKMTTRPELSLLVDIGTNGEIVLGSNEYLIAGAGAAGPALEGGISENGMRAAPGAVDAVRIENGELHITTIGGKKPLGICGSGIVDLLAEMLLAGWMTGNGRLNRERSHRIVALEDGLAVCYATAEESGSGKDLYFTEKDIEQFTSTKAAAHTMVSCLLNAAGVSADSVDTIYLAGAFGQHLNLESAITIGFYPDLPREKFVVLGNSSLQGARDFLLNRQNLPLSLSITRSIYYLEFAMQEDFLAKMQAARFYPHTDLEQYPSVKKKLLM